MGGNSQLFMDALELQPDRQPRRPNLPDWVQPRQLPNGSCATAECAANLTSAPSDNRNQQEIDKGQCKMVCQISLLVSVAACNIALQGGLKGLALGTAGKAGVCEFVCR